MELAVFTCSFLVTCDVEWHLTCLCGICTFPLVRFLLRSVAHLLNWVVHFLIIDL